MKLDHKPKPEIIAFYDRLQFKSLADHVREVRKLFDWPGIPYHDAGVGPNRPAHRQGPEGGLNSVGLGQPIPGIYYGEKFNRWFFHDLPVLKALHHQPWFVKLASDVFGLQLKPSYAFLSMYGPEGVCPLHQDRPQCQFTIDLQVRSNGDWPIYVDDKKYVLQNGKALCYSGTGQPHYRKPMAEDSIGAGGEKRATYMDLAFFHWVPVEWQGTLS